MKTKRSQQISSLVDCFGGQSVVDTIDFKNLQPETLDTLVDLAVDAFGKQFTRDDFYDGIDARCFVNTIVDTINRPLIAQ